MVSETGLLNPASIRRIADQIGLRPTKTRGQNFVHDANTVRRIVSLAQVGAADRVIEVGPGLGSLTLGLLETGAEVVAIEIDEVLANQLPGTVAERMPGAAERLEVVLSDALDVKVIPGADPTALVANLPYNVAVPVLLHMLAICPQWSTGVVMVQSEVADRLVAAPGSKIYGVPSAKLAWYAEAIRVGNVPPTVFWPVPNVDSGLVRITRRRPPHVDGRDPRVTRSQVFRVVDAAFASRRKMLRSALAGLCGGSMAASELITAAGIDPTARGEALDIGDLARVVEALAQAGALSDSGQV
nr:16S rRNA (adenine(1518)-N(6)/adenine(1519)-N(6))-dimethyltransferase RsmA [Cutibacterium acnes]